MTTQEQIYQALDLFRDKRDQLDEIVRHIESGLTLLNMPLESPQGNSRRTPSLRRAEDYMAEVLRDLNNSPTSYHVLASLIVDRGYQGIPQPGETMGSREHKERIARSISGALSRKKKFEALGNGVYRLFSFENS